MADSQSFETYLISGQLSVIGDHPWEIAWKMRWAYEKAYQLAWRLIEMYKLSGDKKGADIAWTHLGEGERVVHLREWFRVYAQAWYDQNSPQYTPRIASSDYRIIMPFQAVRFGSLWEGVDIKYAGYQFEATDWLGTANPMWQRLSTIPGNLVALDLTTDENKLNRITLTILVYSALTDTPNEFALWLRDGVKGMQSERKEHSWIQITTERKNRGEVKRI